MYENIETYSADSIWKNVLNQWEDWRDMVIATITNLGRLSNWFVIDGAMTQSDSGSVSTNQRERAQSTKFKILFSNSNYGNISIAGPQSSLIFYGAYNKEIFKIKFFIFSILRWLKKWKKSDTTTGALQFVDGMTLFYCDANEDVMIPKDDFQNKSFHTRWNHWLFHFEIFISKAQQRYQTD